MPLQPADHDAVQGAVGLTVAAAIQPVPHHFARAGR
jgi:hypothetical protein